MSAPDDVLAQAVTALSRSADEGGPFPTDHQIQAVLAAAVRAYAARVERGGHFPAFSRTDATATDVVTTATAMLDAVEVGIFELSMWQTLKSAPKAD